MNRAIHSLKLIFERDLDRLKDELLAYKTESNMWKVEGEITNCAGNLFLHLCGNLKHFIGANLGNTGYIRERDREFSDKNVSRADIATNIDETKAVVSNTLENLDPARLEEEYTQRVFQGKPINTHLFLLHLSGHLMYHTGQVNYHRRLLDTE